MINDRKDNLFRYFAAASGLISVAYLWFYHICFEPNPLYGDRASTASNIGRDHWAAFIIWGFLMWLGITANVLYACKKFNVPSKLTKILMSLSFLGTVGFTMCKNEKLKRFSFTLTYGEYTGKTYTADYKDQTLVNSRTLVDSFLSKKSLHSAFSIIFAAFAVAAVLYILIYKMRQSKKWQKLMIVFAAGVVCAVYIMKNFLGGMAENVVISGFYIPIIIINFTDIMMDKVYSDVPQETVCKANL